MRLSLYALMLLNPNPTDGGGAGGGNGTGDGAAGTQAAATTPASSITPADFASALRESERLRNLYEETKNKLPPEDSKVLTGELVADFDAYARLGKPADVETRLAAGDAAIAKVAEYARRDQLTEAAEASGMVAKVLIRLAGPDLPIEVKEGTVNGKPGKVAEVLIKTKEADGTEKVTRTPLAKYAEVNWPEFKASLMGEAAPKPIGTPRIAPQRPAPTAQGQGQGQGAERPATRRRATWN